MSDATSNFYVVSTLDFDRDMGEKMCQKFDASSMSDYNIVSTYIYWILILKGLQTHPLVTVISITNFFPEYLSPHQTIT